MRPSVPIKVINGVTFTNPSSDAALTPLNFISSESCNNEEYLGVGDCTLSPPKRTAPANNPTLSATVAARANPGQANRPVALGVVDMVNILVLPGRHQQRAFVYSCQARSRMSSKPPFSIL